MVSLAVAAATVAIVLVVAVSVVPAVLFALQKKGLDQRWAASVGTPAEVFERVIPHGASSSALRLDRAAAAFGIDLTPGDDSGSGAPNGPLPSPKIPSSARGATR